MYDDELRRIKRKLKNRKALGLLEGKDIYLFGVSDNSRQIIHALREMGIEPQNVIDNDKFKQGSYCSRLKVIPFSDIDKPCEKNKLYIIYSAYWREMIPQLTEVGISSKRIWRLNHKPSLLFLLLFTFRGRLYHRSIEKKYGDVPIFVCPYTGTGDIYLIGTFWEEYTKRNNISDYVFVVISGACKKVASMFDIKNVELVRKKELSAFMIDYYRYDNNKGKIIVLNDCWAQIHTNQVEWFRGYKGLYFTQLFRRFVFNLSDDVKPKHPVRKNVDDRLDELFRDNKLLPGKTVILSPYSNTLSDLPETFWEEIADMLKRRGYVVITNSSGKTEPPIDGTEGVFFPLDIAPWFVEKAGAFIGVRSGFCDVISSAKAKKIILYDKRNRFYMSSAYDYFNLKDMELCDDAMEIEYDIKSISSLIKKVTEGFAI